NPVQFTESFRLHCTVAEFLQQAVYRHDGIPFFSNLTDVLPNAHVVDPYVSAVLSGNDPLVVVEHGDREHQLRNPFEAAHLVTPILKALLGPAHGLTPEDVGVVVPHRAQRAELKKLTADLGPILIDTVEKFQGDERKVIVVSATRATRNTCSRTLSSFHPDAADGCAEPRPAQDDRRGVAVGVRVHQLR
ncbi:MAG: AAA domain-containing protein, partial [Chloroflexia bacterium]